MNRMTEISAELEVENWVIIFFSYHKSNNCQLKKNYYIEKLDSTNIRKTLKHCTEWRSLCTVSLFTLMFPNELRNPQYQLPVPENMLFQHLPSDPETWSIPFYISPLPGIGIDENQFIVSVRAIITKLFKKGFHILLAMVLSHLSTLPTEKISGVSISFQHTQILK